MSKSLKPLLFSAAVLLALPGVSSAQDVDAGAKVFKKCAACHAVGEGAKNKVGPVLNEVFGRTAGTEEGFKYSKAMTAAGEGGLVWSEETLLEYLRDPKGYVKGNKMSFAGLKKEQEERDLIAYLKTFSSSAASEAEPAAETPAEAAPAVEEKAEVAPAEAAAPASGQVAATDQAIPEHGVFHLGRKALDEEVAAWDMDVRPDGQGLPAGKGTVAEGEVIFGDNCAVCHGDFGEGRDRWPVLAGGQDTLQDERPEKTIGSYWPYLSTVYDYIHRAMPFGNARSLSDDDVYALTAYLLYLNDIVTDEDFELSKDNFSSIHLPNEANFIDDNRAEEAHNQVKEACMKDCKPAPAEITMRARALDVTPDAEGGEGGGSVD